MTKNIEPINRDIPPFAEMWLNGTSVTHFMDAIDLPEGKKRQSCDRHLQEGLASEMLREFNILGCHFPKVMRSK